MKPIGKAIPRLTMAAVGCAALLVPSAAPAATLAAASPAAAGPAPTPSSPTPPGPTGDPGEQLLHVSATSARNAWAVGATVTTPVKPVVLHWNGTAWSPVATPDPSINGVSGVSAVSADDAWLVGVHCPNRCATESALILHWNGTAWSQVASPNPAGKANFLSAVSASSPGDAWAVGSTCTITTGTCVPLLLHWNGTKWSQATSPAPGVSDSLEAVATISAGDAWAVGRTCNPGCFEPLIMHWNGTRWSTSAIPPVGPGASALYGITATSAKDVWAVGRADVGAKTVILHWDGRTWSTSPSPDPGSQENVLSGVTATSRGNAWAVGSWCPTGCAVSRTLIVHWDGTAWSQVASPSPGPGSALNDVAATSSSNAWAVGGNCTGQGNRCDPIMLHWNGKIWAKA